MNSFTYRGVAAPHNKKEENRFATIYGSPGVRVRFLGMLGIYWPVLLALFLCGWFLQALLPLKMSPVVSGICLLALIMGTWVFSDKASQRFSRYIKGAHGEEIVARELSMLPRDWTVFHGLPRLGFDAIPGGNDFDHIAIGTHAVFVIETKNWSGPVTVNREHIYVENTPVRRSPVSQVRREVRYLQKQFSIDESIPIYAIVCFASNGLSADKITVDSTILCNLRELRTTLDSLNSAARADTKELIEKILRF